MDFNPSIPIWLQVVTLLEADIVSGKLPPGSKLPGGRDLAAEYSINPNTAARVYQELEARGSCFTRRGLGTFVTDDGDAIRRLREETAKKAMELYLKTLSGLGYSHEEALSLLREEIEND